MSETPQPSDTQDERRQNARAMVIVLQQLLQLLFPDTPTPDMITLEDIKRRYRLTGRGAPAMRAIEQSQRIIRSIGNYKQIGWGQFHIGLVFLHWGDFQAAAQHFMRARQQWSFIDDTAATCLAHFAEGVASYFSFAYEASMTHLGKTENLLPRIQLAPPFPAQGRFTEVMNETLMGMQTRLRNVMWPAEPVASDSPPKSVDDLPGRPNTPIPAHHTVNESFIWFKMARRQDEFLAYIEDESWLLVDTRLVDRPFRRGELIVVESDFVAGSLTLQPQYNQQRPLRQTYLAQLDLISPRTSEAGIGSALFSANSEPVTIHTREILGVVVGVWQAVASHNHAS